MACFLCVGTAPRLALLCKMDDNMNRKLVTDYYQDLTPAFLADELVSLGFINEVSGVVYRGVQHSNS